MLFTRLRAIAVLVGTLCITGSYKKKAQVYYSLSVNPGDVSTLRVSVSMQGGTSRSVRLGMAKHPEYDDRFWRYLTDWHVDGFDKRALLTIDRENVWRVISHAGYANVGYSVRLPHEDSTNRPVWHTVLRADGGSINPVDTFLYLADYPDADIHVTLGLPTGHVVWGVDVARYNWGNIAMSPSPVGPPNGQPVQRQRQSGFDPLDRPTAIEAKTTDIATLLDSPILYGKNLRYWPFKIEGVPHLIAYWPLPKATPFDTVAFVDAIQKVAREAVAVFEKPSYTFYQFLLEDGAYGALEHRNSVTIGMPSRDLAKDPFAYLSELAHEFFHTWNLIRLYPEGRAKRLSVDPPEHTKGLWVSEGFTMYYAEALPRRAGFPEENMSRKDLLARELEIYYERPGNTRISPEIASERAVDTTGISGDYDANYYVQGRLIATALDLILRDSTRGAKGLDDFMRAMYDRFAMKHGFTTDDVERTANDVCGCRLNQFFDDHVREARPLDFAPYLKTIGMTIRVDSIAGTDDAGNALPDTRIWAYPRRSDGRMRVWIQDPASIWGRAGLHTGQDLVAFNGTRVDSFPDFRRAIRTVQLGGDVPVDIVESMGQVRRIMVHVTGYDRPRVTIVEDPAATPAQVERRRKWEIAR